MFDIFNKIFNNLISSISEGMCKERIVFDHYEDHE